MIEINQIHFEFLHEMKILRKKILFLILLELLLSHSVLCDDSEEDFDDDGGRDDDSSSDEQPDNEISADVKDVMKVIGSVLPAKLDDKSKTKHYILANLYSLSQKLKKRS
jgi:hypothetical protein